MAIPGGKGFPRCRLRAIPGGRLPFRPRPLPWFDLEKWALTAATCPLVNVTEAATVTGAALGAATGTDLGVDPK